MKETYIFTLISFSNLLFCFRNKIQQPKKEGLGVNFLGCTIISSGVGYNKETMDLDKVKTDDQKWQLWVDALSQDGLSLKKTLIRENMDYLIRVSLRLNPS